MPFRHTDDHLARLDSTAWEIHVLRMYRGACSGRSMRVILVGRSISDTCEQQQLQKDVCVSVNGRREKRGVWWTAATCGLSHFDVRDSLVSANHGFLSPHRPRDPESPSQTEAQTRAYLALAKAVQRVAPVIIRNLSAAVTTAGNPPRMPS